MDLTQAMQAATEDPPPTTIDVDDLVTRERRRSRNLDRMLGAAIAAALVVAALAVPRYGSGSNTSSGEGPPGVVAAPQTAPPGTRPPRPTQQASVVPGVSNREDALPPCEQPMISVPSGPARSMSPAPTVPGVKSCEVLVPRLQQAFDTATRRELTNMQVTNLDGSPLPSNVRRNWNATLLYHTMLAVGTSGGWLQIEVEPSPSRNPGVICMNGATAPAGMGCASDDLSCPTDTGPRGTCSVTTVNGVVLRAYESTSSPITASVDAIHPDGTMVQISTNNTSPATKDQLIRIAVDKAISIY